MLNAAQGMVAISNYQCDLMDALYPSPTWHKVIGPKRTIHSTKGTRSEVLWTNYNPRLRIAFLDAYQSLLLAEPGSAISQPLKEAFLSLRQAAESAE